VEQHQFRVIAQAFAKSGSCFLILAIRLDSRCIRSSLVTVMFYHCGRRRYESAPAYNDSRSKDTRITFRVKRCTMPTPKPSAAHSKDATASVKSVVASLAESWNRHDMAAAAFCEDADFVNAIGILMHSRARRSTIRAMAIPVTLPALRRERGNPNWGHPSPPAPALATEFELRVGQLQLTPEMYTSSLELRTWCEKNRYRCYSLRQRKPTGMLRMELFWKMSCHLTGSGFVWACSGNAQQGWISNLFTPSRA
jgi:hypothetical protein